MNNHNINIVFDDQLLCVIDGNVANKYSIWYKNLLLHYKEMGDDITNIKVDITQLNLNKQKYTNANWELICDMINHQHIFIKHKNIININASSILSDMVILFTLTGYFVMGNMYDVVKEYIKKKVQYTITYDHLPEELKSSDICKIYLDINPANINSMDGYITDDMILYMEYCIKKNIKKYNLHSVMKYIKPEYLTPNIWEYACPYLGSDLWDLMEEREIPLESTHIYTLLNKFRWTYREVFELSLNDNIFMYAKIMEKLPQKDFTLDHYKECKNGVIRTLVTGDDADIQNHFCYGNIRITDMCNTIKCIIDKGYNSNKFTIHPIKLKRILHYHESANDEDDEYWPQSVTYNIISKNNDIDRMIDDIVMTNRWDRYADRDNYISTYIYNISGLTKKEVQSRGIFVKKFEYGKDGHLDYADWNYNVRICEYTSELDAYTIILNSTN